MLQHVSHNLSNIIKRANCEQGFLFYPSPKVDIVAAYLCNYGPHFVLIFRNLYTIAMTVIRNMQVCRSRNGTQVYTLFVNRHEFFRHVQCVRCWHIQQSDDVWRFTLCRFFFPPFLSCQLVSDITDFLNFICAIHDVSKLLRNVSSQCFTIS